MIYYFAQEGISYINKRSFDTIIDLVEENLNKYFQILSPLYDSLHQLLVDGCLNSLLEKTNDDSERGYPYAIIIHGESCYSNKLLGKLVQYAVDQRNYLEGYINETHIADTAINGLNDIVKGESTTIYNDRSLWEFPTVKKYE